MAAKIPGGYILEARCIGESDISKASPSTRELWTWLLRNVNYKDMQTRTGKVIARGEMLTTYQDIIDGLSWYRGYRKCKYNKTLIETGMKTLRNAGRITTTKTTRGVIVKVVKFSFYQNPKNYEDYTNAATATTTETLRTPHDKRRKKEGKEEKKKDIYRDSILELLSYFKEKTGKEYDIDIDTGPVGHVRARFKDGKTLPQMKAVVDIKTKQWKGDPKWDRVLRLKTLFNKENFQEYYNESQSKTRGANQKPWHAPTNVGKSKEEIEAYERILKQEQEALEAERLKEVENEKN